MRKQIFSFKNALRGIWNTVKSENHMRFHMVSAFYVLTFSLFYDFSATQVALLVLLIGIIMALEVLNTCIEELCNLIADRYEPLIRLAKDASAGAVLVMAISATAIAVIFFFDTEVIGKIFAFFIGNPVLLVLLVLSAVLSVIFVRLGPVGIKEKFLHLKKR